MGIDAEMFVRVPFKPTEAQLRDWHFRLGSAFHHKLWIFKRRDGFPQDPYLLFPVDVWEQDGDDIVPDDGETFLRFRPQTRFYGIGYERGDLPTILMLAEFVERLVPGGEVWYGGDSSGVCAERFDAPARNALFDHFVAVQCNPYYSDRGSLMIGKAPNPECPYCKVPCPQFGFGGSYSSHSCQACGWKRVQRGDYVTSGWDLKDEFEQDAKDRRIATLEAENARLTAELGILQQVVARANKEVAL